MNLRWLIGDFIDPQFHLTREQKRAVKDRSRRARFFARRTMILGPVDAGRRVRPGGALPRWAGRAAPILAYFGTMVAILFMVGALARGSAVPSLLLFVLAFIVVWIVSSCLSAIAWRPWCRRAMYELGHPICIECGYPLTGIDASRRCPECGWRRERRDDPPPVGWTEQDRQALRAHGYEACGECGGILLPGDRTCPRCGEERAAAGSDRSG